MHWFISTFANKGRLNHEFFIEIWILPPFLLFTLIDTYHRVLLLLGHLERGEPTRQDIRNLWIIKNFADKKKAKVLFAENFLFFVQKIFVFWVKILWKDQNVFWRAPASKWRVEGLCPKTFKVSLCSMNLIWQRNLFDFENCHYIFIWKYFSRNFVKSTFLRKRCYLTSFFKFSAKTNYMFVSFTKFL